MTLKKICAFIATLGPVGYFFASGTSATLLTIPFVYCLQALLGNQGNYFLISFCLLAISIIIIKSALEQIKKRDDPSEIVLDEVIGCFFVFWAIPLSTTSILVGFLLFRALDIIKFGWVKKAEQWADAWGVVGDDMVAALITNIILRILF